MKKLICLPSLVVLLLLISNPKTATAKAPTIRITISGGGLANTIEVVDSQILAMSDVWSGQFLDASRSPEYDSPKGRQIYELSFFVEIAKNDVRKMYVAYYEPGAYREQGFIYLPGNGPARDLNVGTILRDGQDGKWNYASSAWEALIKPIIDRAESRPDSPSTLKVSVQKSAKPSRATQITVDSWTSPQPGWLYVLDPRSESDRPGSRIWLLDPNSEKVMGSVQAGYDPDYALSPDGSHLYVLSGERESGELAIIDTATGTVHNIPFLDRVLYRPWYDALPPFSAMQVSPDGRALWILTHHLFSPEKIGYQLTTLDTQNERLLHSRISLGNCGYGEFVTSSTGNLVDFFCPTTNRLRMVQLDADYRQASFTFVKMPWPRRCGVSEAFLSSRDSTISLVRGDGAIYEMDPSTQQFNARTATGDCQPLVFPFSWPRSPDGQKLYLGYGSIAGDGMSSSNEFRIFDTSTWQQLGKLRTSVPFWSATASKDGSVLYAVAPERQSILVIDATTFEEKRTIHVGRTPSLAVVAP